MAIVHGSTRLTVTLCEWQLQSAQSEQCRGISNLSMLLFQGQSMVTVRGSTRLTVTLVKGSCNLLH